jgi:hypothetical protein
METHEESVTSCRSSVGVKNVINNERDSDRRKVQTGLFDWIG